MGSRLPRIARPGWGRTSLRFLLRSLSLRHAPFLLALAAVAVGATVAATMMALEADLGAKMSRELRRYGPNLLITPVTSAGSRVLDEEAVRIAPSLVGSDPSGRRPAIALLLVAGGTIRSGAKAAAAEEVVVVGAQFDPLSRLNPAWRIEGAWPRPGEAAGLLGSAAARRANVAPGAEILLEIGGHRRELRVAGILHTGESEEDQLLAPLPLVQEATGLPGKVSLAAMSVDGGATAVRRAAAEIERRFPGVSARPLWQVAAAQGALLGKLDRLMFFLTLVVLFLCGLCVMTTLLSIVLEREREIGLMRALGAGDLEILVIFLGEVSLLGLVGGTAGLGLGTAAARMVGSRLFGSAIALRPSVIPLVISISLGLCWIAVLVPLRRALAIQPAAAMRGD